MSELERLRNWWSKTNVIIKNEKTLMINDEAMQYITDLEQRIDNAKEYIKNNSYSNIEFNFLTRESNVECHFNNKADPRDLLEILGDKENE